MLGGLLLSGLLCSVVRPGVGETELTSSCKPGEAGWAMSVDSISSGLLIRPSTAVTWRLGAFFFADSTSGVKCVTNEARSSPFSVFSIFSVAIVSSYVYRVVGV